MMHVETSAFVRAPSHVVCAVYAEYPDWPRLFSKIRGVRLARQEGAKQVLEIDHAEGTVVNEIVVDCPRRLILWEVKRHYDGRFLNRFDDASGGTRFTVVADLRFKGYAKALAPLLAPYVRRQIEQLQIQPVVCEAEERASRAKSA